MLTKRFYSQVPKIFNSRMKTMQKNRSALNPLSQTVDYLKDNVADRVADRILDIKRDFKTVLDFGCGAGHLIKYLDTEMVQETLVQYDSCELLMNRDTTKYPVVTEKIVGDLEKLPFENNTFDAVISSMALHWVNDLPGTLVQINNSLKPDGVFIGAMLGGDTLYELRLSLLTFRTSLQLAETERYGGLCPHISPMVQHQDIGSLLSRTGFELTTVDVDEITINYPSMFELITDLQAMGESNAMNLINYTSRDVFMAASAIYESVYGEKGRIPATFQIIYMIGWKPHFSQPKPKERGSQQYSFKDLDKIKDIKK
ncbi:NADH dehydrogenase [ubiquinone] 1 alpha subcomplex assembly factor 5 [Boothiomyces sp. JEL0866]|nr:NADH dehydrogenase [ubiquinone] 1 alpha subcomplex assembly factor 5 [Boothiomyces sp. JEL0866]